MNSARLALPDTAQGSRSGLSIHTTLLWMLSALFAVRVLGQAIQRWWPRTYLPPFDAFQGSRLSYPTLLSAQAIILGLMVWISWRATTGSIRPSDRNSVLWTWVGGIYMSGSVLRIVIGLASPHAPHWFRVWIPAFFHLVLAGFVLTLAFYFRPRPMDSGGGPRNGAMNQFMAYVWYPAFLIAAIAGFCVLLAIGAPTAIATYLPIFVVGISILALEPRFPERVLWRPKAADVKADAAFLTLVQVALPRALAAATIFLISTWTYKYAHNSLWPHHWPLAAQIVTMVLIVDFLRYWLHRACHHYPKLWRLHEVHHSPEILYALNVGRFHPLEKALHFCLDTVPFLLLGVAPQVIAAYFLLYSVNGFFQHSNLRLRYGALNYVVGSAETHRWHHARDPKAASCNFSNTTILWDLVFGTWYLPADKDVEDIGVLDRGYPTGFLAQMTTPFRTSHD
jgi:sterol desaturase/sphingolipid hydroxylase (fatty acid hydroxylase superfamily)